MILTVTLNTAIDKLYVLGRMEPHQVMRVEEVNNTAGGKGLNVSRVAALLGEKVTAMGFTGGHNGALLESMITEPAISKEFTHTQAETRSCINIRDRETNQSTEFLEPGSLISPEEKARFLSDFTARLPYADVITISGSLPKGIEPDFYATLIRIARPHGKIVILDTSGEPLRQAIVAQPFLIKPNTDEIRQLTEVQVDSETDLITAARRLCAQGISITAVSLGKKGVLVVSQNEAYRAWSPDIPVVNTVGCGDSMVAGFAAGLSRKLSMTETIRCAVAVSTANALTKETGFFQAEDYTALLPQIKIQKL